MALFGDSSADSQSERREGEIGREGEREGEREVNIGRDGWRGLRGELRASQKGKERVGGVKERGGEGVIGE